MTNYQSPCRLSCPGESQSSGRPHPVRETVGGAHPNLREVIDLAFYKSETHFAQSMKTTAVKYREITGIRGLKTETKNTIAGRKFLDWWKWDSIGAACEPRCGGCRCSNCQPRHDTKQGKRTRRYQKRASPILKQMPTVRSLT